MAVYRRQGLTFGVSPDFPNRSNAYTGIEDVNNNYSTYVTRDTDSTRFQPYGSDAYFRKFRVYTSVINNQTVRHIKITCNANTSDTNGRARLIYGYYDAAESSYTELAALTLGNNLTAYTLTFDMTSRQDLLHTTLSSLSDYAGQQCFCLYIGGKKTSGTYRTNVYVQDIRIEVSFDDSGTYTVVYDGNGKTGGTMYNELFDYGEAKALTACAYTRTGYHFAGWNTESDGSGTAYADGEEVLNLTAEPDATLTLYAQWTANTYTVHFEPVIPVNGTMADMTLTYDQEATALTKNAFSTTTGQWLRWNTERDGSGTSYEDEQQVQNLTAEQGGTVTLYAQWRLQHRFNYDSGIFRCYNAGNTNEVYWAYAGETVKVEVIDGSSEYTIYVTAEDGTDIAFDTETNTFTMPDQEVYVTATSVKKMAYTTILLDDFDAWTDVVYLYDASQPTVTPTVTVKDGETVLTEGTDYTLEITNNTGSATQMVTATVTVTGKGGYVGTATQTFRITPFNIANCEIRGTLEAYDNGYGVNYPLEGNVEVWNGETQLELGTDYSLEVEYAESYEVGEFYNATVTGTGDWGGSKTFQFQVVELHHTVVFDANGGSGTMASDIATKSQYYYLPECAFTAPAGQVFDHWEVSCEPDEEKQPGDYFTAPYIWSENDVQTITVTAYWRDALILLNDDSAQPAGSKNADIIAANNGKTDQTVVLSDRTLSKNGDWNTLCLPFDVTAAQIAESTHPLYGATIKELNASTSNLAADGTLTLNFTEATSIEAGRPYIVKWSEGSDISDPVFTGVTIDNSDEAKARMTVTSADGKVKFVGQWSPFSIGDTSTGDYDGDLNEILYVASGNQIGYSAVARTLKSCRAHFWVKANGAQAGARSIDINYGDGETTSIILVNATSRTADGIYTLDGRKLSDMPTRKGIYIVNGKKIVVK